MGKIKSYVYEKNQCYLVELEILKEKIDEKHNLSGKTIEVITDEISELMCKKWDTVHKYIYGNNKIPKIEVVRKFAEYLECDYRIFLKRVEGKEETNNQNKNTELNRIEYVVCVVNKQDELDNLIIKIKNIKKNIIKSSLIKGTKVYFFFIFLSIALYWWNQSTIDLVNLINHKYGMSIKFYLFFDENILLSVAELFTTLYGFFIMLCPLFNTVKEKKERIKNANN